MKLKTFLGVLVFSAFSSQVFGANQTEAEFIAKAKADVVVSMKTLQTKLQALGAAKLEVDPKSDVPILFFGTEKINKNFKVVDEVKKAHGGTATVFVKKSENEFVRVSTNVMKDGDSRAIGTFLGQKPDKTIDLNNLALVAIKAGQEYEGVVDILKTNYQTKYAPIFAADKKTVLGIYYVGYPLPAKK